MNIGVNTFLFSSPFSNEHLHLLKTLKQWGFDCVELAVEKPEVLDAEQVNKALMDSGLSHIITCGVYGPGRDLRGTPNDQQAAMEYTKTVLDMMPVFGSTVLCGPLYSAVGHTQSYSQQEKQRHKDTVASHLDILCRYAQERGVVIAMEVLNRFETDFINTSEQAIDMIERVGSPALKIHLDTFHMNIEESNFSSAIIQAGDHLGHFHASANHRGIPGQDHIPWIEVRESLETVNYKGDIVIESFSKKIESIARTCSIWRELGTPEQVAREGLSHLKAIFNK